MKMNCSNALCQSLLVILTISFGTVSTQRRCVTPENTSGRCIPATRCTRVSKLLEIWGANLPTAIRDSLLRARCTGETPDIHICCDYAYIRTATTTPSTTSTTAESAQPRISNANAYEASLNDKGLQILNSLKCGSLPIDRIAFGEETGLAEFPWMALLRYNSDEQPYKCGGSLVTDRYVLTAAHCYVGFEDDLIGILLGEHDLKSEIDCERRGSKRVCAPPVEEFGIDKITAHPEYSSRLYINDVALIRLDRNVDFKVHISPICLPTTELSTQLPADSKYFISGWGTTENGTTSKVLLKAIIPHKDRRVCQNIYKRVSITKNHICAGGDGRTDSCKGDSGGPLFFVGSHQNISRYVQSGIVSFGGIVCGSNRLYPGLYANVVDLMPWITNNIV